MAGLCRHDTARKLAAQAQTEAPAAPVQQLGRTMRYKLGSDRARLKKIASMQRKAEVKAEIVPEYLPYIHGMMESGGGDELLTQVMVWAFDAGLWDDFTTLAKYAINNGVAMPTEFARPLGSWLVESVAKHIQQVVDAGQLPIMTMYAMVLWLESKTSAMDMHDEIRAKLYRACGEVLFKDSPIVALQHFETALQFDSHIRVKNKIKVLKEQLAKTPLNGSQSPQGQAAGNSDNDEVTPSPVVENSTVVPLASGLIAKELADANNG